MEYDLIGAKATEPLCWLQIQMCKKENVHFWHFCNTNNLLAIKWVTLEKQIKGKYITKVNNYVFLEIT